MAPGSASETLKNKVRIGSRTIGDGEPCFVIAEAGSNHNGSLGQAKKLIDVAAEAGADAVKFQVFRAPKLYPRSAGVSDYLQVPRSIYEIISEMEMPYEWIPELARHCEDRGVFFLSSVFDERSADEVEAYVPAFKIASYEMTHTPLVEYVAGKGNPVIVSTGAAHLEEVAATVEAFRRTGNDQLVLLQCTARYPAPTDSLNLKAITVLKREFGVPVGLSDHSTDPVLGPVTAVALGANVIEKHFTLSKELPGPDHRFAVEPSELRLMVEKVREAERALGAEKKTVHPVEEELRAFARRSVFAIRDIEAGEELSTDNIAVLRNGKLPPGLPPQEYPGLLGRRAARPIRAEAAMHEADLA